MSIGPLKQRSSWPSSFVTGLIGWIGFFIIVAVLVGEANSAGTFFLLACVAAIAQVLVLRLLFFVLRLDRSMIAGAVWGGVTGVALILAESRVTGIFNSHLIIWLLDAAYIGIAVGLFLCYFHRDDGRKAKEAASRGRPVDYGRDAHWLEPFFFGAVAYLVAFLPSSFSMAAIILVVGAVSGVVAAGVSHFFIFTVARKSVWPIVLAIAVGSIQGAISGLLFRQFAAGLFLSPFVHGAIAGSLTYLMTAIRGRYLADKEVLLEPR
jgi:hypothetical protein